MSALITKIETRKVFLKKNHVLRKHIFKNILKKTYFKKRYFKKIEKYKKLITIMSALTVRFPNNTYFLKIDFTTFTSVIPCKEDDFCAFGSPCKKIATCGTSRHSDTSYTCVTGDHVSNEISGGHVKDARRQVSVCSSQYFRTGICWPLNS